MDKKEIAEQNELKKKELKQYRSLIREAERAQEDINEFRRAKSSPSFSMDGMPHGSDKKDLSDYAAKLDELISKLIKLRYKKVEAYSNIRKKIELIENEKEREVLYLRYIRGIEWEEICVKMKYEWTHIHRIHRDSLKNYAM